MSLIDYFAAFILIVLAITAIAVFIALGMAPGYIAKNRNHPWAEAVTVAGWVTLICGFVLWPLSLIWAFVDAPHRSDVRRRHDRLPVQCLSSHSFSWSGSRSSISICSGRYHRLLCCSFCCSAFSFQWDGRAWAPCSSSGSPLRSSRMSLARSSRYRFREYPTQGKRRLFRIDPVPFQAQVDVS